MINDDLFQIAREIRSTGEYIRFEKGITDSGRRLESLATQLDNIRKELEKNGYPK